MNICFHCIDAVLSNRLYLLHLPDGFFWSPPPSASLLINLPPCWVKYFSTTVLKWWMLTLLPVVSLLPATIWRSHSSGSRRRNQTMRSLAVPPALLLLLLLPLGVMTGTNTNKYPITSIFRLFSCSCRNQVWNVTVAQHEDFLLLNWQTGDLLIRILDQQVTWHAGELLIRNSWSNLFLSSLQQKDKSQWSHLKAALKKFNWLVKMEYGRTRRQEKFLSYCTKMWTAASTHVLLLLLRKTKWKFWWRSAVSSTTSLGGKAEVLLPRH